MDNNVTVVFGFLFVCAVVWIIVRERRYRAREEEFATISNGWLAHEQELIGYIQKMRRELMASYKAQESLTQQLTELHTWREKVLKRQTTQQNNSGN